MMTMTTTTMMMILIINMKMSNPGLAELQLHRGADDWPSPGIIMIMTILMDHDNPDGS